MLQFYSKIVQQFNGVIQITVLYNQKNLILNDKCYIKIAAGLLSLISGLLKCINYPNKKFAKHLFRSLLLLIIYNSTIPIQMYCPKIGLSEICFELKCLKSCDRGTRHYKILLTIKLYVCLRTRTNSFGIVFIKHNTDNHLKTYHAEFFKCSNSSSIFGIIHYHFRDIR